MYDLNWDIVVRNLDVFLGGLRLGLVLAAVGLVIGSLIGLLVAFARTSGNVAARTLATVYVDVIRNVPLLLLIFVLYFGLPIFAQDRLPREIADRLLLDGPRSVVLALSIYSGAYLAEIFRAGIVGVSARYLDAGRSLGLTKFGLARHVTLPLMFRSVLPSLSNSFISLFKDTSLAAAVSVPELTYAARELSTNTFRVIEAWTAAGVLYLITSYGLALALRAIERRIRWTV